MNEELPAKFTGPSAWVSENLANNTDSWLKTLTSQEVAELESAAKQFLSTGKDIGELASVDFEIPELSKHLQRLKQKLLHGNGLEVIRGLPVEAY